MPPPASYDETTLATYMRDGVLKRTGTLLKLTALSDYAEAVNEVADAIGSAIADATDITRLRALAKREAWRLAMQQSAGDHSASDNGASHDRQQIYAQCKLMFEQAVRDVAALDTSTGDGERTTGMSRTSMPVPNKAVW